MGDLIEVPVLSDEADMVAVRLDELVQAISETIVPTITKTSELTVEIAGGITLSGKGSVKWLFFNVGGEAKKSDTLKVTLKTTLEPLGSM
jgi:hypothetical protein